MTILRKLALLLALGGCLALPSQAMAVITISSDRALNCSSGQGAPSGFSFAGGVFSVAEDLVISSGATLSLASDGTAQTRCVLNVNGSVTVAGTLEYDQKASMERAGLLEVLSNDAVDVPGRITVNGTEGVDRSGANPGDGTSGGDGGTVLVRAPRLVTINGAVEANGGNGGDASSGGGVSSGNGGNGGDPGGVVLIADFGTLNIGGSASAIPGAGGENAGSGVNGDPGSNSGVVRRNALELAGAGPVAAAQRPVNLPPVNLALVEQPSSGSHPRFRFTDRSDEETAFVLIRSANGGPFAVAGSAGANRTTISDSAEIRSGVRYRYLVVPIFPAAVWPNGRVASNLVQVTTSGASGSDPGTGTVSPLRTGPFSVNRARLRSRYAQFSNRRGLRLSIRTTGTGRLRVSLRVRTSRGRRTATRTVRVTRGGNRFTLRLPSGWRPGRYTLRMTTIALNGERRSFSKVIRLRYRR